MFDCVNTEYLTECTEDDTKSLSKLVKVRSAPCYKDYICIMFNLKCVHSTQELV